MRRILLTLVLVGTCLAAHGAASADTPGCVSENEYVQVTHGMTKSAVHELFDTSGTFVDGGAGGYARGYPRCGDSDRVIVDYAVDRAKHATVSLKKWESNGAGDVRIWLGGAKADSFDLVSRKGLRRDHVYARGGDDYVFMHRNGYPDVIHCGGGDDLVQLLDGREKHDVYLGCEKVSRYSP